MNPKFNLRRCVNLFALLAMTSLLTGCVGVGAVYPHTTKRSPEVRGRVLDAKTKLPIKGAKIEFMESPHHTIFSDKNGCFRMKATRNFHWGRNFAGGDMPMPKMGTMVVSHPDYLTADVIDNGDIFLQPKRK